MMRRNGDPAPTFPGLTLNIGTTTPIGDGLTGSPRLTPNGELFYGAAICGVGAADDRRHGDLRRPDRCRTGRRARGRVRAHGRRDPDPTLSGLGQQSVGMSRTGRFVFKSTLTGGDTSGATNNDGVFTGTLGGALEWVIRKGDTLPGGEVIASTGGFLQQINDSGQILHDVALSTTAGTNPATPLNDRLLFVYTPGMGNTAVMREGDAAPGTVGATFNSASWFHNVPPCAFTQNGQFMVHAELSNGDVVAGVNDRAIYVGSTSGLTMGLRRGDPAPGTDATFNTWNYSNSGFSTGGRITIGSTISGGTSTLADNSGIWSGMPGNLQLAVREGDILPGSVGAAMVGSFNATDSAFGSRSIMANDAGQVLFITDLVGGDVVAGVNDQATCIWDPVLGLRVLARRGDQVETLPGVFKTISSVGPVQFNNGDNQPLSFTNGITVVSLFMLDGTSAVAKVGVPSQPGGAFCSGDGSGTACPCANNGLPGHGCASSISPDGGQLVATGIASLSQRLDRALGLVDAEQLGALHPGHVEAVRRRRHRVRRRPALRGRIGDPPGHEVELGRRVAVPRRRATRACPCAVS